MEPCGQGVPHAKVRVFCSNELDGKASELVLQGVIIMTNHDAQMVKHLAVLFYSAFSHSLPMQCV